MIGMVERGETGQMTGEGVGTGALLREGQDSLLKEEDHRKEDKEKILLQRGDREETHHQGEEILQKEDQDETQVAGGLVRMKSGDVRGAGVETGGDRESSQRRTRAGEPDQQLPGEMTALGTRTWTGMRDLSAETPRLHQSPSERGRGQL